MSGCWQQASSACCSCPRPCCAAAQAAAEVLAALRRLRRRRVRCQRPARRRAWLLTRLPSKPLQAPRRLCALRAAGARTASRMCGVCRKHAWEGAGVCASYQSTAVLSCYESRHVFQSSTLYHTRHGTRAARPNSNAAEAGVQSRCCSPRAATRPGSGAKSSAAGSSAVTQLPSCAMRARRTTVGCGHASPQRALRAIR